MNATRSRTILAFAAAGGLLAFGSSGCGVDENLYNACQKDLKEQKATLKSEQGAHKTDVEKRDDQIAILMKKLESLGQDVSRLSKESSGLGSELDTARKRMEELKKAQALAEARASQFRNLVAQFRKLTDAGKLQVEVRENRMIVRLGDQILFDKGKTTLKPEGQEAIRQVTLILKDLPNRNFQVAGHTDNVPIKSARFRNNWDLSAARAVEVVNFMIASGMEAKRLSAAGYADQSPVAANDSDENMAKNRRIEITLVPNIEDLPPLDDALKDQPAAEAK